MRSAPLIKLSGIFFFLVTSLAIGLTFFLPQLIDVNGYRTQIITSLSSALHRQVNFVDGSFDWRFGPLFRLRTVTVRDRDGITNLLEAEQVSIRLALLPLLSKQVVLNDIRLESATVRLRRDSQGNVNIDDLLTPASKDDYPVRFKRVAIKNSRLEWHDELPGRQTSALISAIDLNASSLGRGKKGKLELRCTLPVSTGAPATLSLNSSIKLPKADRSLLETDLHGTVDLKQADLSPFWNYTQQYIPFGNPGGRVNLATSFDGILTDFSAKGSLTITGASVSWPTVFHGPVAPRSAKLEYAMKLNNDRIDLHSLSLVTDGFKANGSVLLRDYRSKDPYLKAVVSTPVTFTHRDVKSFIPYGIIPADVADYIEHKITAGVFRLDTGILEGHISQIAHMEQGENYNTLLIRGPVEQGVLSYGSKVPTFTNLKGILELKGKNFSLVNMTGSFGAAPFKLNGSITEYNTHRTSEYPVTMEITPGPAEVGWLARMIGANKLDFSGPSQLTLNGTGTLSAYHLNGEWRLKQAAYSFPGAIRKPAGMVNNLAFSSTIGRTGDTRITSLSYSLPPLNLSATAAIRFSATPHMTFELQTNSFVMGESLPILEMWRTFQPKGKVQAHIKGTGNPEDFSAMDYTGTINFAAFSLLPRPSSQLISGINGVITFKGNSLETSHINAHYGDSPIQIKGRIKSIRNEEGEVLITSPLLQIQDLYRTPIGTNLGIQRLSLAVGIKDSTYTIRRFSGRLKSSPFTVIGEITTGTRPEGNLSLTSRHLDLDDLLLLGKLVAQNTPETPKAAQMDLKLTVAAKTAQFGKLDFTQLQALFQQQEGVLYIRNMETELMNGRLVANGRMAATPTGANRYDLTFSMERINADMLLHALDITREVTGTMTLDGNITATGTSVADLKKTALGNIRLKMEKGTLRKFSVLSKVFSILNISQLFTFKLPDMVSGGMPYTSIIGSFAVTDGTVTTQDLFISSNAMNISAIGKANLIKEDLNFSIGVQALQTVDKVVNRIPVVGWILTGDDKDFLTTYFEARGPWSNPQVTAIPVKSLAGGVFNIFKRVFQLPVKLFTDTGEVLLGQ